MLAETGPAHANSAFLAVRPPTPAACCKKPVFGVYIRRRVIRTALCFTLYPSADAISHRGEKRKRENGDVPQHPERYDGGEQNARHGIPVRFRDQGTAAREAPQHQHRRQAGQHDESQGIAGKRRAYPQMRKMISHAEHPASGTVQAGERMKDAGDERPRPLAVCKRDAQEGGGQYRRQSNVRGVP